MKFFCQPFNEINELMNQKLILEKDKIRNDLKYLQKAA